MANPPPHHSAELLPAAAEEEDYIDMDISSTTRSFLYCCTVASPPHFAEFEFQMCANTPEAEAAAVTTTIFPSDQLFCNRRILPSHQSPGNNHTVHSVLEKLNTAPTAASTASGSTPSLSCKLNAEDYFLECSSKLVKSNRKKKWSKKLKTMKKSSLGLKLKATRDYLKSLFSKSICSVEPTVALKAKECSNGHWKSACKLSPVRQAWTKRCLFEDCNSAASLTRRPQRERLREEDLAHRKSFSGAINWNLVERSKVSYQCQPQMLKRSSSGGSEVECSVQGAIAYCKRSQQTSRGRKSVSDAGFCTLSPRRIAAGCHDDKEKPGLCRG